MNFKNKRVFISGGNGVIGKELTRKLHDLGAVVMVGDLKPRPIDWPSDIRYRQGDLNYIPARELLDFKPQFFFHLAATFERSVENYDFWEENYQHNVNLSNYLMTILKDAPGLEKVIFASSYLIYHPELYQFENPQTTPVSLKETDPILPRNLTGVAKLNHEIELRFLNDFKRTQYKSVSARIYRSFGKNSRDIISRWIRMLLKNEPLTVYSKEGIFDYIYAGDVAEGLLRLGANIDAEGIYNLGSGKSRSIADVIEVLRQNFPDLQSTGITEDIPYEASQADMSLFKKTIGWKPPTTLEKAIPMIIEFEKNRNNSAHVSEEQTVLVTSISKKVPLLKAVRNATSKYGPEISVAGGDINDQCIGRYFVDKFWLMPRLSNLSIAELKAYCNANNIRSIIPTRDGELAFWAQSKEALAKSGISIMISTPETVDFCLDKLRFFQECSDKGFPAISTYNSIDNLDFDQFVVKERFGAGALSIGLNLDKESATNHAKTLESPIFQPFIKGTEISIDLYIDKNSAVKGCVPRIRQLIVNGESQVTTTYQNEKLEALCRSFASAFAFYGHIILQVMEDDSGNFHLIECNCRFGGASTTALAAGLDSFYWFLLEANDVDISEYAFIRPTKPITQIRFPEDIIL
ncbi:MAG: NAD-dependent epimerase/dehydratase family protein [Bacteroidota bacterium]